MVLFATMFSVLAVVFGESEASLSGLPPLIRRDLFFDNPEKTAARISPDGSRLSYLAPKEGKLNVYVRTRGKNDDCAVTNSIQQGILHYFWATDSKSIIYLQDNLGNENFHLYLVNLSDPNAPSIDLTPFDNVRADIIDIPRGTSDEILISLNLRDPQLFDAYRLNLKSGKLILIAENPGNIGRWLADSESRLRVALAYLPEGGSRILARKQETAEFEPIASYENEDNPELVAFTADDKVIFIASSKGSDRVRLLSLDLETGIESVVDEDNEVDLARTIISEKTRALLGTVYFRERAVYHLFTPEVERDFEVLRKVLPGDIEILSWDSDEQLFIVEYKSDLEPGATYLYVRTTGEAELLFKSRPWLKSESLAVMRPFNFISRDGLKLHGYLTTPRGVIPRNLPLVLNVHGGPWERDKWGYHAEAQFLANRGYAVLQVNYRGSTGYGKEFMRAAQHEFAGKMQDDLVDAVNWAVENGFADPTRVAIYGGSYGGYAALVGLSKTPDVFACGIDYVGPSSLITLIKSFPPYWKPFLHSTFYRYVGNPNNPEDIADLKVRSPLYHVEQIKSPLFIAQGANDPRVKKAESDRMVEALRRAGKEVEYMVADNEGHGFKDPTNRLDFYQRMETFLAKYLGGRTQ